MDYCCENQNNLLINFDKQLFNAYLTVGFNLRYNVKLPIPKQLQNLDVEKELVKLFKNSINENQQDINIKEILLFQHKTFFRFFQQITNIETQLLSGNKVIKSHTTLKQECLKDFKIDENEFRESLQTIYDSIDFKKDIKKQSKQIKDNLDYFKK